MYYDDVYNGLDICAVQIEHKDHPFLSSFILRIETNDVDIPGGKEICARVTVEEFAMRHLLGVLRFSRFSKEVYGAGFLKHYLEQDGRGALHESDAVRVFSQSADEWVDGEVVKIFEFNLNMRCLLSR